MSDKPVDVLTDLELMYAATGRCRCGAGLAHPLDHDLALRIRAWICSAVLKGEAAGAVRDQAIARINGDTPAGDHDILDFAMWKVREETSINNKAGYTTRPPGTVARTVGHASCQKCGHAWTSEPYSACGKSHHWFPGQCPSCGNTVGGSGTYRSGDGPRIETRYPDVVLSDPSVEAP